MDTQTTVPISDILIDESSASQAAGGDAKTKASKIVSNMTLEEKVAQLFIVTPETLTGFGQVTQAGDATRAALAATPVGGLVYFGVNIEDPKQLEDLLEGTQSIAEEEEIVPLFLCVDEEGGTVRRIGSNDAFDVPDIGDAVKLGEEGADAASEAASEIAEYVLDCGFNVDFAPVCDIAPGPESSLYKRSFGDDAQLVSEMVAAEVKAFLEEGLLCAAKHFPGIGDPEEDSHEESISSDKDRDELEEQLAPFKAAIDAGVPIVMVSHLSLPNITGNDTPACLSADIVQKILREEMKFDGVVVTDSLAMAAITDGYTTAEAAVMAIEAGCDIPLMPIDLDEACEGIMDAIDDGRLKEERIDESVVRILATKISAWPELFDDNAKDDAEANDEAATSDEAREDADATDEDDSVVRASSRSDAAARNSSRTNSSSSSSSAGSTSGESSASSSASDGSDS